MRGLVGLKTVLVAALQQLANWIRLNSSGIFAVTTIISVSTLVDLLDESLLISKTNGDISMLGSIMSTAKVFR